MGSMESPAAPCVTVPSVFTRHGVGLDQGLFHRNFTESDTVKHITLGAGTTQREC